MENIKSITDLKGPEGWKRLLKGLVLLYLSGFSYNQFLETQNPNSKMVYVAYTTYLWIEGMNIIIDKLDELLKSDYISGLIFVFPKMIANHPDYSLWPIGQLIKKSEKLIEHHGEAWLSLLDMIGHMLVGLESHLNALRIYEALDKYYQYMFSSGDYTHIQKYIDILEKEAVIHLELGNNILGIHYFVKAKDICINQIKKGNKNFSRTLFEILLDIVAEYCSIGRHKQALDIANRFHELIKNLPHGLSEEDILQFQVQLSINLMHLYHYYWSPQKAYKAFSEAEEMAKTLVKINKERYAHLLAQLYTNGSSILYHLNLYEEAIEKLHEAIKILEELALREGKYLANLGFSFSHIALGYRGLGDFQKAIDYYKKALDIYDKLVKEGARKFIIDYAMDLLNIGVAYKHGGDTEKAIESWLEAINVCVKNRDLGYRIWIVEAMARSNLGAIYLDENKYKDAINTFKETIRIYRRLIDMGHTRLEVDLAMDLINIAKAYIQVGETEKALNAAKEAEKIGRYKPKVFGLIYSFFINYADKIGVDWREQINKVLNRLDKFISCVYMAPNGLSAGFKSISEVLYFLNKQKITDLEYVALYEGIKDYFLGSLRNPFISASIQDFVHMKNRCELFGDCIDLKNWEMSVYRNYTPPKYRKRGPPKTDFCWISFLDVWRHWTLVIKICDTDRVREPHLTRENIEYLTRLLDLYFQISNILNRYYIIPTEYLQVYYDLVEELRLSEQYLPDIHELIDSARENNVPLVISASGIFSVLPIELMGKTPSMLRIPVLRSFSIYRSQKHLNIVLRNIGILVDYGADIAPLGLVIPEIKIVENFAQKVGANLSIVYSDDRNKIIKTLKKSDIFHYTGHGAVDRHPYTDLLYSYLSLSGNRRIDYREIFVSGASGGLAFLSSCSSSFLRVERGGVDFYSVSAALFSNGFTVCAPAFPILETHAFLFVKTFYECLAKRPVIYDAVFQARRTFHEVYSRPIAERYGFIGEFGRYLTTYYFVVYGYPFMTFNYNCSSI